MWRGSNDANHRLSHHERLSISWVKARGVSAFILVVRFPTWFHLLPGDLVSHAAIRCLTVAEDLPGQDAEAPHVRCGSKFACKRTDSSLLTIVGHFAVENQIIFWNHVTSGASSYFTAFTWSGTVSRCSDLRTYSDAAASSRSLKR